jgi:5,10-methylenetetrahydrofolate reductase
MCEAHLPAKLEESLQGSPMENHADIGAKWALNQVSELLQENCPGFHLYALNKPESTLAILEGLSRNP